MKTAQSAGRLLHLGDFPAVVAVVGCCGKTTFIESVSQEFRRKKVLISPTTKIKPMTGKDVVLGKTLRECAAHVPAPGIQCLGLISESGKLESLPLEMLCEQVKRYDLALLEADGSRGLPCKGWLYNEPVVLKNCTHTIGIVTLNALGKAADETRVLRLPEFLALTGLRRGDTIEQKALTDMVCADDGMFRSAAGRQCIFVNQVEDEKSREAAAAWLEEIRQAYKGRFACLAYGSARRNEWTEVC